MAAGSLKLWKVRHRRAFARLRAEKWVLMGGVFKEGGGCPSNTQAIRATRRYLTFASRLDTPYEGTRPKRASASGVAQPLKAVLLDGGRGAGVRLRDRRCRPRRRPSGDVDREGGQHRPFP